MLLALVMWVLPIHITEAKTLEKQIVVVYDVSYLQANEENQQIAYKNWLKQGTLQTRAYKLVGAHGGQCVEFVRTFLGTSKVSGKAKNNTPNTNSPSIGAVIVTNESSYGHVGVVINYTPETVMIAESNVPLGSEKVEIRTLKLTDPRIRGYINVQ